MRNKIKEMAPEGQIWVCSACGKHHNNRYAFGDASCFLNAVLCYDDETLKKENGRVVSARAVEKKDIDTES